MNCIYYYLCVAGVSTELVVATAPAVTTRHVASIVPDTAIYVTCRMMAEREVITTVRKAIVVKISVHVILGL
jgi:hypothetical protein